MPTTVEFNQLQSRVAQTSIIQNANSPLRQQQQITFALIVWILTLNVLIASSSHASELPPDYDEVTTGTLFLHDTSGYTDSPVLDSSVELFISGMVARVSLEQSFDNNGTTWVEGIYVFPLPDNAAVNGLTILVGDRVIEGQIAEKKIAEKKYTQAKENGQIASLVKQNRPNLFTTRIANIAPGEMVKIKLDYIQTIDYRDDRLSLRFPMTLTPRYANASVTDSNDITPPQKSLQQAIEDNTVPTLNLTATIYANEPVENLISPTHELVTRIDAEGTRLEFPVSNPMDQDFILNWSLGISDNPMINAWQETVADSNYLLAMVIPPKPDSPSPTGTAEIPRELILVIDTSGSMAGDSIKAATRALRTAVDGLKSTDRFNIIEFDSYTRKLFPNSVIASSSNLDQARRFIRSLYADGGTEMVAALEQALANPIEGYLRQAVFITDGSVGNEDALFRQIDKQLRGARLFTVGIGSAPNSYFMKKAAQAGRGTYTWVREVSNAETTMTELFHLLEQPVVTDLQVSWLGAGADYAPSPISDLYAGEPVVLSAKLEKGTTGMVITGKIGNTPWTEQVDLSTVAMVETGLSTVWARQKIDSLLDAQLRSTISDVYKPLITKIALQHKLLSPYTSFIAIDETPVRAEGEPLTAKEIANLTPVGTAAQSITIPRGASGADLLLIISLISTLTALLCWIAARQLVTRSSSVEC